MLSILTLVILILGCQKGKVIPSFPPQQVDVISLKKEVYVEKFEIPCTVFDSGTVKISFPIGGVVKFTEAQGPVESGKLLIELRNDDLIQSKEAVEKELNFNKKVLERFQNLSKLGGVSKTELERQESLVKTLEGRLSEITRAISDTQFIAPTSGVVGPWQVKEGEAVNPNQIVGVLKTQGEIFIDCKLTSSYAGTLAQNPFSAELEGYNLQLVTAKPSVDLESDTISLRFRAFKEYVNNQILSVKFSIYRRDLEGYFVPVEAVKYDFDGKRVFVVTEKDGKFFAKSEIVKVEGIYGDRLKIDSNLQEGTLIVSKGISKVFDGSAITFDTPQG